MRVALVKQTLDVHGPWSSVLWNDTDPKHLFDVWPGRALFWEMTCLLEADWYVIPQSLEIDYTRDAVLRHPGRAEMVTKYTEKVVEIEEIPFEKYDVVITIDPVLRVPLRSGTLFAYYVTEHWDRLYSFSLRRVVGNYDLFLAHMMDSLEELLALPQPISFPYLRSPVVVRSTFQIDKLEAAWVDWRTLTILSRSETVWISAAEAVAKRLEERIGLPVRYKGDANLGLYAISEPPRWGDAARYLESMGKCRYYISVGRGSGAGQGLCDAVSLGCICFGQSDKAFHRLVCHPACLCDNMIEMPRRVRRVISSMDLQAEILAWQDEAIKNCFVGKPIAILEKALNMKHRGGIHVNAI